MRGFRLARLPWIRVYTELLHDPKMRRLTTIQKWIWVGMMLMAGDAPERGKLKIADGLPFTNADLSAALDLDLTNDEYGEMEIALEKFTELKMIEIDESGTIIIRNFEKRQYDSPSDHPAAVAKRVKRHREKKCNEVVTKCNARDTDKDTDTDKEKKEKKPSPRGSVYSSDFLEFWEIYPRRKEKAGAFKAWKTCIKEVKPEHLILAASRYAKECAETEPQYVKLPATFLGPKKPYEDFLTESDLDPIGKLNRLKAQLTDFEEGKANLIGDQPKDQLDKLTIEAANNITRQMRNLKRDIERLEK
jgi:hypothetical protein